MKKVYTSALVIIPPQEIWEPIQAIRRKYDKKIDRWMPHISLLYPFKPEKSFFQLIGIFEKKIRSFTPFMINFGKIKSFSHGRRKHTIWLDPEPKALIKKIQTELLALTPDCNDLNKFKTGYIPHLSLGQVIGTKEKLQNTRYRLQKDLDPLSFKLKKITYITRDNDKLSKFQVKKDFLLKQS